MPLLQKAFRCLPVILIAFLAGSASAEELTTATATPTPAPTPAPAPAATPTPTPEPALNTDAYRDIEDASPQERADLVHKFNKATNARLAKSHNYRPIEKWLKSVYSKSQVNDEFSFDSKHSLQLIDRGLGKPTELVYSRAGFAEVLFSTAHYARNNKVIIVSMTVSPDHKLVALVLAKTGSLDQSELVVFNLDRREIEGSLLTLNEPDVAWASPTEILIGQTQSDGSDQLVKFDTATQESKIIAGGALVDGSDQAVLYIGSNANRILKNSTAAGTWTQIPISRNCKKIIGVDTQFAYLQCLGEKQTGEVRAFPLKGTKKGDPGSIVVSESDQLLVKGQLAGRFILLTTRMGADRRIRVYDAQTAAAAGQPGAVYAEIRIPDCCSVSSLSWLEAGKKLRIRMVSAVQNKTEFIYDINAGKWDKNPETLMMTTPEVIYKTTILTAKSKDGTSVPVRVTMRADSRADGTHPVYFLSYGGFNRTGYFDPVYKEPFLEFMRRGGILATPALRGGNELGPDWHTAATRTKKINTFDDLAAAAKVMIDSGWTTKNKIISEGTSNGGLTVAATALLYPDLFGLVMPCSGVLDLLGRDRMDPRFEGWDYEYGSLSEQEIRDADKALSPLELVTRQGALRFVIFTGLNDSRVNTAHSLKFTMALSEHGGHSDLVDLVAVKNSGHWMGYESYQNLIGWHADAVKWTAVFDQAGWTW